MAFLSWLFGQKKINRRVEDIVRTLERSEQYSDYLKRKVMTIKTSLMTLERLNAQYAEHESTLIRSDAVQENTQGYEQAIFDQAEAILGMIAEVDPNAAQLVKEFGGNQRRILSFLLELKQSLIKTL